MSETLPRVQIVNREHPHFEEYEGAAGPWSAFDAGAGAGAGGLSGPGDRNEDAKMGLFDEVRCLYPLPVDGANALVYQTKDLACFMDRYEIREDGTLWHEDYDIEDHSDPNAVGIFRLRGLRSRVRQRWQPESKYTGEVRFYSGFRADCTDWIEWSAYFVQGRIRELHLVRRDEATDATD